MERLDIEGMKFTNAYTNSVSTHKRIRRSGNVKNKKGRILMVLRIRK